MEDIPLSREEIREYDAQARYAIDNPDSPEGIAYRKSMQEMSTVFGGLALSIVVVLLITVLKSVFPLVLDSAHSTLGRILATATVMIIAVILLALKLEKRMLYGFLELGVGGVTVWQSLGGI